TQPGKNKRKSTKHVIKSTKQSKKKTNKSGSHASSKSKSKRSTTIVYRLESTDDDDINEDHRQAIEEQYDSNNSDQHEFDAEEEEKEREEDNDSEEKEETSAAFNRSFASDDTHDNDQVEQQKNVKRTTTQLKEDVLQYFIKLNSGEFMCSLCPNGSKVFPPSNSISDTNLRSYLGRLHKLYQFLYPSQRSRRPIKEETISPQRKKKLDAAAIDAIVQGGHAFNIFRKGGMKRFLSEAVAGYRGPDRRTVVKRLKTKYKQRRSSIREEFSRISDIALSVDTWQSNRRDHFVCLSAHYYDKDFKYQSNIIAFRRFIGTHSSDRIKNFLINEVEKLDIQAKICSITSDNGPDINAATRSGFGMKLSCYLHVLNLVVRNELCLFDMPVTESTTTSSSTNSTSLSKTSEALNSLNSSSTQAITNSSTIRSSIKPTSSSILSSSTAATPATNSSILSSSTAPTPATNSTVLRSSTPATVLRSSTPATLLRSSTPETNSSILCSTTTKTTPNFINSVAESISFVYSSVEDNDYDSLINPDKVSEELSDDNGSNTSSQQDGTVTTSISSLYNESVLSSLENDSENDLNSTYSQTTEEEDFFNEACNDITVLLKKVHILLERVRKLIGFIHQSSVLNRYVIKEMKLKIENYNRTIPPNNLTKEKLKFKELTLDMKIRWSSPYVMLFRFIFYKSVLSSLTYDLTKRMNLTPRQNRKLKKLSFTSFDWTILETLQTVLDPFYHSTKALSTRKRPTLSCNKTIMFALANFLTIDDNVPMTLETLLKKQLLLMYGFYMEKHISDEQSRATLVASFLDPSTYRYLSCDDKKEAEAIISSIAIGHLAKINSQASSSTNHLSTQTTSSIKRQQNNQSSTIEDLLIACGLPVQKAPSTISNLAMKPSKIKEEIARYIANHEEYNDLTDYWNKNQFQLPILVSIVRKYNIMCATSIECESAFSIAGYLQRKTRSSLAPSTLRYSMILHDKIQN
ncbi:unnamed protein product, partial [Adineta steineri]